MDDYYLAGGTALSLYYYQHRESFDLDFFTTEFSGERVLNIVSGMESHLDVKIESLGEQMKDSFAKMAVYLITFRDGFECKIDFVEDFIKHINPVKTVDGIKILSLEDLYLRKIYTIAGNIRSQDLIGRETTIGGRQDAKDFFDVYCLSSTSCALSDFVFTYGDATLIEGLIQWFHTYDRMNMKTGLLDLITHKDIDYRVIEDHFKKEIDKLLGQII